MGTNTMNTYTLIEPRPAVTITDDHLNALAVWEPHPEYDMPDRFVLREGAREDWAGRVTVTVALDQDHDTTLDDYDLYGKIEWIDRYRGAPQRPDGFDGAARILWPQSDRYWWQPPEYLKGDPDIIEAVAEQVQDIVNHGFTMMSVTLEVEGREEHAAYLGGLEPFTDEEYLTEVARDLVREIIHEFKASHARTMGEDTDAEGGR